jgi:hypothetical protein
MAFIKLKSAFSNASTGLVWTLTLLPTFTFSLPQPTEPNQHVHADLFGPLKTTDSGESLFCA